MFCIILVNTNVKQTRATKLGADEDDDDSLSEDSELGKESECLGDVVNENHSI